MSDMTRILAVFAAGAGLTFAGCENESGTSNDAASSTQAADDGHDHADADHERPEDHAHEGEERALGTLTLGGATLEVAITGAVEPNADLPVNILHAGGPTPVAVRFWIGTETGEGSLKSKADAEGDYFHGHAEAPAEITADAAFWVEVETDSGERVSGSVPLG